MSAYRQAMLSVAPERVEQFSIELKHDIDKKKSKKKSSSEHRHSESDKRSSGKSRKRKSQEKPRSKRDSSSSRKNKERSSHKKKRKSKSEEEHITDVSDMEENGLDLKTELHPLSFYVKDRRKLLEVMFHIIRGEKMTAMLPDILKSLSDQEVRERCFLHLEVMSSKRIQHILEGEPMESSSGTDSEEDRGNEALPKVESSSQHPKRASSDNAGSLQTNFVDSTTSSGCDMLSLLADGSHSNKDNRNEVVSTSRNIHQSDSEEEEGVVTDDDDEEERKKPASEDGFSSHGEASDEESMVEEEVEIVEDEEYEEMVDAMLEETLPPPFEKEESDEKQSPDAKEDKPTKELSQLELLELQLRARAIRSLMKAAQDNSNDS